MTKKEFLQGCWVNINTRIPSGDDRNALIIKWCPEMTPHGSPVIGYAFVSHIDAREILKDKTCLDGSPSKAVRYFEWWMPCPTNPKQEVL